MNSRDTGTFRGPVPVPRSAFPSRRSTKLNAATPAAPPPIGSALVNDQQITESEVALFADPALGARGADVQAEMARLVVPWLSAERMRPVVRLVTDTGQDQVMQQAEALGMRPAVRLREGRWRDGVLYDTLFYELLNPVWVERLGDPGPGIAAEGAPVPAPAATAPRRTDFAAPPLPDNALIGSGRPYREDGSVPQWKAILDESGRVMVAIAFNNDLGDSYQYADDPDYPAEGAQLGLRMGVNFVVYALTH